MSNDTRLPSVTLPGWAHDLLEALASFAIVAFGLLAGWHPVLAALAGSPGGPLIKFVKHKLAGTGTVDALHDGAWEVIVWSAGWTAALTKATGLFGGWTIVGFVLWWGVMTWTRRSTQLGSWGRQ